MGRHTEEGESPVDENLQLADSYTSTTGHVKSRGNMGGPSSKPKYYPMTDREQVLWRKGEKHPGRGVKEYLKPCAYKHLERVNAW